jgi:triacylglycerol lipase
MRYALIVFDAALVLAVASGCNLDGESEDLYGEQENAAVVPRDPVVLVHGNGASPSSFRNTVAALKSLGYTDAEIFAPDWGSKSCLVCNDHCGAELTAVSRALDAALAYSPTGRVDVISHSMGVTLAARAIADGGHAADVDAFVGIAGGFRGLNACRGSYTPACSSSCGLQPGGTFVRSLTRRRFAARQYVFYSLSDMAICGGFGGCFVGGVHASVPEVSDGSFRYGLDHIQLLLDTASDQVRHITGE